MFEVPPVDDRDIQWACDVLGLPATAFHGDGGNESFDHPKYIEHKRAYKDELIGIFRGEVSDAIHHKTF